MKTIYFIRHGEAIHNPPVKKYGKEILTDKKYEDAKLTNIGIKQCLSKIESLSKIDLDIVFVSPLRRTLQTATILFKDREIYIHAIEDIRERYGVRPCDKRSGVNKLKKIFPNINFDKCIDGDEDPIWDKDYRESEEELMSRISNFLEWIKTLGEKNICVITHQGYLMRLYKLMNIKYSAPKNCEIIKLVLS